MVSRILIILGLVLLLTGLFWPWLQKMGLGRLPGDIVIDRDGFKFYFPITTSVIISLLISLFFWLIKK